MDKDDEIMKPAGTPPKSLPKGNTHHEHVDVAELIAKGDSISIHALPEKRKHAGGEPVGINVSFGDAAFSQRAQQSVSSTDISRGSNVDVISGVSKVPRDTDAFGGSNIKAPRSKKNLREMTMSAVAREMNVRLPPIKCVGKLGIANKDIMDTLANDGIIYSHKNKPTPTIKNIMFAADNVISTNKSKLASNCSHFVTAKDSMSKFAKPVPRAHTNTPTDQMFFNTWNVPNCENTVSKPVCRPIPTTGENGANTRYSRHGVGFVTKLNLDVIDEGLCSFGDAKFNPDCPKNPDSETRVEEPMNGVVDGSSVRSDDIWEHSFPKPDCEVEHRTGNGVIAQRSDITQKTDHRTGCDVTNTSQAAHRSKSQELINKPAVVKKRRSRYE